MACFLGHPVLRDDGIIGPFQASPLLDDLLDIAQITMLYVAPWDTTEDLLTYAHFGCRDCPELELPRDLALADGITWRSWKDSGGTLPHLPLAEAMKYLEDHEPTLWEKLLFEGKDRALDSDDLLDDFEVGRDDTGAHSPTSAWIRSKIIQSQGRTKYTVAVMLDLTATKTWVSKGRRG